VSRRAVATTLALASLAVIVVAACSAPEQVPSETVAIRSAAPYAEATVDPRYAQLIEEGGRLIQAKRIDEARAAFAEAHALASEGVEARYGLGVVSAAHCWGEGRECDACIERLSDVITRGGFRHSHYNRGQCHFILGKYELALADYDVALEKTPDELDALEGRGVTLVMLARRAEGCASLERLKRLGRAPDRALNEICPSLGPPSKCTAERWGGWSGTAVCARAASRELPGAHRECTADADCIRVGNDCAPHAVNREASATYQRIPKDCTDPAAGPCAPPRGARCDAGCCVVDG